MRARLVALLTLFVACARSADTMDDSATSTTAATTATASTAGGGCANTLEEARAQLATLEQQWETAFYRRDTAFFSRTLDDEFVVAGGPTADGKKDYIADLLKAPAAPDSVTGGPPAAEEIRPLTNDVVVASGVWTNKAAPTQRGAYTEVFVCRNGQWKAVHGHYNALAPARR